MCKKIFILLIIILIVPLSAWAATENLDEMLQRKSRYSSAVYGPDYLEDPITYAWQPESLCYTDVETGHEVWVLFHGPDQEIIYGKEYALDAWSFDGSTIGAFINRSARGTNNPNVRMDTGTFKRWLVKTDGSKLKAATGYANEGISEGGFGWAHTENAYYGVGVHSSWDAPPGMLVKNIVDSKNEVSGFQLLDLNQGDIARGWPITIKGIIKRPVSSDDNWISLSSRESIDRGTTINCYGHMRVHLKKGISPSIVDYWGINRGIHEYYDHKKSSEYKAHGGGNWAFGRQQEYSHILYTATDHIFFQLKSSGSAPDGGPKWEDWNGNSYGNEEIMVMTYGSGLKDGDETPKYFHQYWNHPSIDVWDEYILTGLGDTTGKNNELLGPGIGVRNVLTGVGYDGGQGEIVNDLSTHAQYDGNHKAWNGWTDSVIIFPAYIGDTPSEQQTIYSRRLHFDTGTKDAAIAVASTHHSYSGNYNGYPRPSQSPDGTKVAFSTIWLNNGGDSYPYISYAVVEYPHPPKINQVTGSGTYTIRFDWQLDQSRSCGYSNRGWPTASDLKPWPRETKKFRLWRSPDGVTGWLPVRTIDANPQDKFDYTNGGLQEGQVSYWEITDTPGDGTWYYAVTSVEHSGLESRKLSNIFSSTGSQSAAYPSNPGGVSSFYSNSPPAPVLTYAATGTPGHYQLSWVEPNHPMVRYYNIYYSTSGTPEPIQQNRIASVPVGTSSYLDWLADPSADGYYVITSVDSQGNESFAGGGVDDTESPTVPTNLTTTSITSSQVNLSWSASTDNIGVAGYKIYRDGALVGSSSGTSFSDTGLLASTSYTYAIAAYDASGNDSSLTQSIVVTTEAAQGGETQHAILVDYGESVKYFKGTSSPGSGWSQLDFDDSSWLNGPTGIGYGDGDDATVLADMLGNYLTVFVRKSFSLNNVTNITSMQLSIDFDDGFVAYLNGQEISRINVAGIPTYDMSASGYNEAGSPSVIDVSNSIGYLQDGLNVFSVVGHNAEMNSSDFSIIPRLEISYEGGELPPPTDTTPPAPPSGLGVH